MALRRLSIILVFAIGISACNEQQSDIPVLSDLRVEPTMVAEFSDTAIISFNYYDYNGDLGHPDPNVTSLSVKDSRTSGDVRSAILRSTAGARRCQCAHSRQVAISAIEQSVHPWKRLH